MGIIKDYAVLLCFTWLWATAMPVSAMSINFDDLDTSGGLDIDLSGTTYLGYAWSNFSAYSAITGQEGFNNGIVSPNNAIYSGGDLIGTISSASLFDFSSAYLNAAYYDNLAVTVEGLLNGGVLFSQTITVSTASA